MNIKNIVTASLAVFIVAVVAILGYALLQNNSQPAVVQNTLDQQASQAKPASSGITMQDFQAHNSPDDCWVIVGNAVYDVTQFAPNHPAGADKILSLCGQDATTAFNTRQGRGPHPDKSKDVLNNYYVGNIIR